MDMHSPVTNTVTPTLETPRPASLRLGAAALALAGLCFLLYPVIRPYSDEKSLAGAAAIGSNAWIAAHLFAVSGFILVVLGLMAVQAALRTKLMARALVVSWVGIGLTLPYYGAEVFGLHAIAQRALAEHNPALLELTDTVRYNPAAATMFASGLILLAIGAIMAAVAIWRSGILPKQSGVVFGVAFALFLPQFYLSPSLRMAHGALVLIGCAWITVALWRHPRV
ncbi:MAG: hypothetical protein JWQ81_5319 [Amycolatopsis sp.]|jgi:hypothetical protein|uniref:hypothetical protein n=1 Tax=Amycolatopsis sp. TaxID=37632 RepID=UPI0026387230|nr:hypothetical protein [Amycolatopsis sp.]MCU1684580.1 hypothetical protein [Amycolatopsis sp.]